MADFTALSGDAQREVRDFVRFKRLQEQQDQPGEQEHEEAPTIDGPDTEKA
jgi:hypothetical protein